MNSVLEVDSYASVRAGMLVAVHCEEKEGRPFLAEVKERKGDELVVGWLKGSWKGVWRQWMVKANRQAIQYVSTISVRSLILWDFVLTSKGRLRARTVAELQSKYDDLDMD